MSKKYTYVFDLPFEMKGLISEFGGRYDGSYKTYLLTSDSIPNILLPYSSKPYSFEAWVESRINGETRKELLDLMPKKDLVTPRTYQTEARDVIRLAIKSDLEGFLLADEVGLGKTISAGLVAQEKEFETILVVTTLAAVAHWRNTFLKLNLPDKDIIIINYDRLQKLFKANESKYKTKTKNRKTKNKRLANNGEAPQFDLLIFDESHKLKNNTSMRSKLALKLVDNAGFSLRLSATAGQNPLELSYLAPLLAKITKQSVKTMSDFEGWCKSMNLGVKRGAYGKWEWDNSQESIDKVHNLLFKGKPQAALRRTPSDIAGYPEISRELMPFELSPEEEALYQSSWEAFKNDLKESKKSQKKEIALVARLRFRQKASLLKVPYTFNMIEDMLDNGYQVAVSVAFKETLLLLKEKLDKAKIPCSVIHGELNATEKEKERVKFQKGETQVVLFTVEESISLHQGEMNDVPRVMLINDIRWSGISMSQIEGRTHRDGKFSQIYWMYFTETIEHEIASIVLNRVISMKAMVGDDTKTLQEIEKLLSASLPS